MFKNFIFNIRQKYEYRKLDKAYRRYRFNKGICLLDGSKRQSGKTYNLVKLAIMYNATIIVESSNDANNVRHIVRKHFPTFDVPKTVTAKSFIHQKARGIRHNNVIIVDTKLSYTQLVEIMNRCLSMVGYKEQYPAKRKGVI